MPVYVRNARTPIGTTSQSPGAVLWVLRELLLLAGWTEHSNDGGAEWTGANLEIDEPGGVNGFTVAAVNPRQVVDQNGGGGRFTSGMTDDSMITLYGTSDRNKITSRIARYIDAATIEIDGMSWNSVLGWANETDMKGRVYNPVTTSPFPNASWVLMNSPVGSGQIRLVQESSTITRAYARPRGQLADPTEGPVRTIADGGVDSQTVFNMVVDANDNVLIYWFDEDSQVWWLHAGLLEVDDPVSDPNPWFMHVGEAMGGHIQTYTYDMMGHTNAMILAYCCSWGMGLTPAVDIYDYINWRVINGHPGKAFADKPFVALQNRSPDGGYVRGKLPIVRQGYDGWETYRPLDESGLWYHIKSGIIVPRNGLGDPYIVNDAYDG